MQHRLVPLSLRQRLVGLLVCALLLTQALGVLHRALHAGGPPTAHAVHAEHDHGTLKALFAQHHDAGDCQIFDQLSHADSVGFGFIEPGFIAPAQALVPALQGQQVAAQAAGYLARGPPRAA